MLGCRSTNNKIASDAVSYGCFGLCWPRPNPPTNRSTASHQCHHIHLFTRLVHSAAIMMRLVALVSLLAANSASAFVIPSTKVVGAPAKASAVRTFAVI